MILTITNLEEIRMTTDRWSNFPNVKQIISTLKDDMIFDRFSYEQICNLLNDVAQNRQPDLLNELHQQHQEPDTNPQAGHPHGLRKKRQPKRIALYSKDSTTLRE